MKNNLYDTQRPYVHVHQNVVNKFCAKFNFVKDLKKCQPLRLIYWKVKLGDNYGIKAILTFLMLSLPL